MKDKLARKAIDYLAKRLEWSFNWEAPLQAFMPRIVPWDIGSILGYIRDLNTKVNAICEHLGIEVVTVAEKTVARKKKK